jgi:adenylosuccinate lyase
MTAYSPLTALSPLDGRYQQQTAPLSPYLSEYALIKTRVEIEATYLIALSEEGILRKLKSDERDVLLKLGPELSLKHAERVKEIEKETKHDVKAMERVFRELVKGTSLEDVTEMIHFGLTSEDVNNLSYRLMIQRAGDEVLLPQLGNILDKLSEVAQSYKDTPMLARTHGQAAIPTTLGHEFAVFAKRLSDEMMTLKEQKMTGKLSGAVGSFHALQIAYPKTDWMKFSEKYTSSLGLVPNLVTTQINTYEDIIAYLQILQRIHGILLDFAQDMWRYISDNWFVQIVKKEEVGSSTMPQKVNPIMFENAEGNLGICNSLIEFFVRKLPVSRLQRDLSDSTVMRNIGSIFGYSLLSYTSLLDGLSRVRPNLEKIENELMSDWSILSEAAQTILRREGVMDPYTILKNLTRGERLDEKGWKNLVDKLPMDEDVRQELSKLTPKTYIGLSKEITEKVLKQSVIANE